MACARARVLTVIRLHHLCAILSLFFSILAGASWAQTQPVELRQERSTPFHFIAYGDTRFTDPSDTEASNAKVRQSLVQAIAETRPAFVSIGGDITYHGNDVNDWLTWDKETATWRQQGIRVYPALGNHDLHGNPQVALANYFQRFPDLKGSRYYSVRAANILMLILDSSLDEISGSQGEWLQNELKQLHEDVDFVVMVLHHPPYTSSSDEETYGGGHSGRASERALAEFLEARQQLTRARFVVFAGHVHNYERHEHGGVRYFVTGGGGAHAYPIERAPDDLFPDANINYHYLDVEVDSQSMKITMNRLEFKDGKPSWTKPDSAIITASPRVSTNVSDRRCCAKIQ